MPNRAVATLVFVTATTFATLAIAAAYWFIPKQRTDLDNLDFEDRERVYEN